MLRDFLKNSSDSFSIADFPAKYNVFSRKLHACPAVGRRRGGFGQEVVFFIRDTFSKTVGCATIEENSGCFRSCRA